MSIRFFKVSNQYSDINVLIGAFIIYVRPMVEYNSVVWSP